MFFSSFWTAYGIVAFRPPMILVPKNATNNEVLDIIRKWVDVLAAEDYEAVVRELGFPAGFYSSPAECLRAQIKRYVSPEYFPGVTDFVVTNWRSAHGGNPEPRSTVIWYKPGSELRGAVSFDLPLNGKWSDLTADFVFFENNNEGYSLALEDIFSRKQLQGEVENL
jgi:hypothetical protein